MAFDDMSGDGGSISQINVTPLVDVMLVLLIIFMVAAPILQQGVELELPKESIAPVDGGEEEQLVVSIDKEGVVYIGAGNIVVLEELGPKISAIVKSRIDKRVFIKADHRATYGQVMAAMARIKRSGIDKVGLLTEPS
ncbi:MAG TPA: ExbD/TolR family protein [Oligoflexia bacterium]|nr:ExbD/TolR family protein [Oligoflexia bacterium]HMP47731.1 ExbD/TolR family protein [Oligoflexia bacterium]